MRYRRMVLLPLLLAACADARQSAAPGTPAPESATIVCEPDGTTTMPAHEVAVKPDGLHLLVENRLQEPASLNGFGLDVEPGVSEWTLSVRPGDYDVACWPFSRHESGTAPETIRLRVLDPTSLYVPAPTLDCEAWSAHGELASPSEGIADDPIEAARRSLIGLEEGDELTVRRWGYPEADDEGRATVVVSRDGRAIAIVGASLADDGRWVAPGASGCIDSGLDFG